MSDTELVPREFDPNNPTVWGSIRCAFQVAGYIYGPPIAVHIVHDDGSMTYFVGILVGIEDDHDAGQEDPRRSLFYFRDSDMLIVQWEKTITVLAMAAGVEEESVDGEPAQ